MAKSYAAILALIILALTLPARAADYYLDSAHGNDAWDGRSSQGGVGNAGPWRTLARLAAMPLTAGDRVRLHCAGSWRETLRINGSGNSTAPLTLSAYGDCKDGDRPQVIASRLVGVWVSDDGEVYSAQVNNEVKQVFVDGVLLEQARYPAIGLLTAQAGTGDQQREGVRDAALRSLTGKDVAGATLQIRTVGWSIETTSVANLTDDRLEFMTRSRFPVRKGAGYYLTGKAWMLSPGRWHWDRDQHRLMLWLADGSDPARHRVEVTSQDYGLHLTRNDYVHVRDLQVSNAGLDGIRVEGSQQVTLEGLEVAGSGRDGIAFDDKSVGAVVQGSTVRASGRDGISVLRCQGARVQDNTVEDSGTVGFFRNSLAAINASGALYARVERNTIRRAGYHGITFGRRAKVNNNVIQDVCLVLDDCGGIYSWSGNEPVRYESEVTGNVISHARGGRQGNPEPYTVAAGIYLDDLTSGVQVVGNTVNNSERGVLLHNAFGNELRNNTLFDNRAYSLVISMDNRTIAPERFTANQLVDNTLVTHADQALVFFLKRSSRAFIDHLAGNTFVAPHSRKIIVIQHALPGSEKVESTTFEQLASEYGNDRAGAYLATNRGSPKLVINASLAPHEVDCPYPLKEQCSNAVDKNGKSVAWPHKLMPFEAMVVISGSR